MISCRPTLKLLVKDPPIQTKRAGIELTPVAAPFDDSDTESVISPPIKLKKLYGCLCT